jgi:hypothetical protein
MSRKHTICRDKCVDKVAPLPAAFQRQAVVIRSSEESEIIIKCNVAYNIAKEEMPFTTFKSEIILMKKNGLNVNPTYSNDTACAQFIGVIGDTLKKKTAADVGKLRSSEPPFVNPRLSQLSITQNLRAPLL